MKKYLVYLKNSPAAIMVIADTFNWDNDEVVFSKDDTKCAVFRLSEIAGWCKMYDGGDAE